MSPNAPATVAGAAVASGQSGGLDEVQYISRFYATFGLAVNTLGLFIQLFLVSRIFDKIGVRGALLVLPLLMIINYSLLFLFTVLAVARYTMIAENSTSYSLQNTTRHALFLPVRREEKYVGKNCIDTFFFLTEPSCRN